MSSIVEIEAAIEKLPAPQADELAAWLETRRSRRDLDATFESWLERARGTALPGITTADVLAITRDE
jgi:hypothetical protein